MNFGRTAQLVGLLVGALMAPTANAFDTHLHLEITSDALAGLGFSADTIALINAGNQKTDRDYVLFNTPEAHFCNERFAAGSQRLRDKLQLALKSLEDCDRPAALEAIGTSLHAIQDFYAHSNFVDRTVITPVDLFQMQDPPASLECSPGHIPTVALTSAYWPDEPRQPGKCSHADLNKDDPERGPLYYKARAWAQVETVHYIQRLEQAIRARFQDPEPVIRYLKGGATAWEGTAHCPVSCVGLGNGGLLESLKSKIPSLCLM